jgi:hypothetical protein
MKTLTRQQVESRKAQAVRFTRDVLGDGDRADAIEGESLEDYAERKRVKGQRAYNDDRRNRLAQRKVNQLEENMTITIEIKPEVQSELSRQASDHGVDLGAYAASLVEEAAHRCPRPRDLSEEQLDRALQELSEFSRKIFLAAG